MLAHKLVRRLAEIRKANTVDYLHPDGKSQVTIEYHDGKPVRIDSIILSARHHVDVRNEKLHLDMKKYVVGEILPKKLVDDKTKILINPTGRFVVGGPQGDTGVTGRKIMVDTYGGVGHHGGGCFSGKDPTKVDRTASYMARYVAKNVVAAGLADACEVQLSYAIGVAEPISVLVNTEGTAKISEQKISLLVRKFFPLTPKAMIRHLNLARPIFAQTSYGGHFGRNLPNFTWEKTDMAAKLRKAAGL